MSGSNLVLIGFMGSGKTTVGRLVAARLGRPFVDADAAIEAAAGRSIAEIFASEGESGFRAREASAVATIAARGGQVIATGGGAVLDPANRSRLRGSGLLVHLRVDAATAWERLGADPSRPLLATADPLARIRELLAARAEVYQQADQAIDTVGRTPAEVADAVLRWWDGSDGPRGTAASIAVALGGRGYRIEVAAGALARAGEAIARLRPSAVHLISNERVDGLYGDLVRHSLADAGLPAATTLVPDGEEAKSLDVAARVYDELIGRGLDRSAVLIALGGGVVGDLTGFVAATYLRGVRFVQLPTTLEAQFDASVGGKVAVNHRFGKNLIGAFHQPAEVLCDLLPLRSLPRRDLAAGLAEAIKHGWIAEPDYLGRVESLVPRLLRGDAAALGEIVTGSCRIKAAVVCNDEREAGLRAVLNFGHTIGHALEAATHRLPPPASPSPGQPPWPWRHGEAVAAGMVAAMAISAALGLGDKGSLDRLKATLSAAGLPVRADGLTRADLAEFLARDKKRVEGRQRWVLLAGPGRPEFADEVPDAAVRAGLRAIGVD